MTGAPCQLDADVAIVGGGPAGWALAGALADRGLAPLVVAPEPDSPWPATYGMWVDELPHWVVQRASRQGVDDPTRLLRHRWSGVRVAGHVEHRLDRAYGQLDNQVLRQALGSAPATSHTARGVSHTRWGSVVHTSGPEVTARLVVNASGAAGLGHLRSAEDRGAQVAYGLVLPSGEVPAPWASADLCTLMDWRPVPRGLAGSNREGPGDGTFLYVLDNGVDALVEETSLVRDPPLLLDELRRRLAHRLGRDLTEQAQAVERVHIPMRPGRPRRCRGQRVVAFGASAGYIHPATGYSVTASLRAAPRVAEAIADHWGMTDLAQLASRVGAAVWPLPQRRVRALHDVGLAALQRFDPDDVRTFFDAFFCLPTTQWSAYLRVDAQPGEITQAMAGVFRQLPARLRWPLMRAHPRGLVTALTGGGS